MPKKYFHDKLILLLASVNVFLAFLCVALVLLRLGAGQGNDGYFVQYRPSLGISAFKTGSVGGIVSFMLFAIMVAIANVTLSVRVYHLRRELSITILGLGIVLLVLTVIVSNALLVLR
ncbi:MAG TPA: hypothetical protein VMY99_00135 [Nevskiaceae bacterium]|nr:hypothetical protein [Nevskiaceae bacterium]